MYISNLLLLLLLYYLFMITLCNYVETLVARDEYKINYKEKKDIYLR